MNQASDFKIHIEDVDKAYGDNLVLDNIDLSVSQGEFCSLVGPSGCGKSTLLRLILGSESPTRGTVRIEGQLAGHPDSSRGIVFQRYSLFPHLTVLENVLLGFRLKHQKWWLPWRSNKAHMDEAQHYLDIVRLGDAMHNYPHELSGGMQQRAAIAQALILKPPVLLMDEPFGALDPDTREDLQVFLLDVWKSENLTIFFITHDLEEACFVGSRMLALSYYYSDDRRLNDDPGHGSKIICDFDLSAQGLSTDVKRSQAFQNTIADIREHAFNPAILQHVSAFNLRHRDSFQTLTFEEHNRVRPEH